MDQHAIMLAGYDKGLKEGIIQGKREIVKRLLENEVSLEQIEKITGLSKEELENIIKN